MLKISNEQIEVDIIHPKNDQHYLGVRYCAGGYIFQVHDFQLGALMSGPTYPESFNWFDGQGIPDAFNLMPLREKNGSDDEVEIIGIGRCDLLKNQVIEFCTWEVEENDQSIKMVTQQNFCSYKFSLERKVSLMDRTVRSQTTITNHEEALIPIKWFPHPFYPQPHANELCRFNIPVTMPENDGYYVAENGFVHRHGKPTEEGFYQALDKQSNQALTVLQRHPLLGLVSATCSYSPDSFPIWGNQKTFSWEPFLEKSIAQKQSLTWSIDYDF